jgi:hypothetical protein
MKVVTKTKTTKTNKRKLTRDLKTIMMAENTTNYQLKRKVEQIENDYLEEYFCGDATTFEAIEIASPVKFELIKQTQGEI